MIHRIPSGTRDVLPDEMRELRALTERLHTVFEQAGYGEVYTPALEYETTFERADAYTPRPAYRMFDEAGNVLVLRPDMTVPIARLVATRYQHAEPPLRFSYFCALLSGRATPARTIARAAPGHSGADRRARGGGGGGGAHGALYRARRRRAERLPGRARRCIPVPGPARGRRCRAGTARANPHRTRHRGFRRGQAQDSPCSDYRPANSSFF